MVEPARNGGLNASNASEGDERRNIKDDVGEKEECQEKR